MKKKQILALVLSISVSGSMLSLTGCGNSNKKEDKANTKKEVSKEIKKANKNKDKIKAKKESDNNGINEKQADYQKNDTNLVSSALGLQNNVVKKEKKQERDTKSTLIELAFGKDAKKKKSESPEKLELGITPLNPEIVVPEKPVEPDIPEVTPKPVVTVINKVTKAIAINYETVYENDDSLKIGETKLVVKGEKGSKEVTTTTYSNGKVVVKEIIVKKPVQAVIKNGTKDFIKDTNTEVKEVKYAVTEQKNPEMKYGERKVIKQGEKGSKEVTTFTWASGKTTTTEKELKAPVNEIVEVGTKDYVINTKNEKGKGEIKVKYIDDNTLNIGEEKVISEGKAPEVEYLILDYKSGKTEKIEYKVLSQGEEKVVRRGTKDFIIDDLTKKETVEIKFEVIENENNTLIKGERKVIKQGEKGSKEVITYTWASGKTTTDENIIKEPTNEVVEVGTKEID